AIRGVVLISETPAKRSRTTSGSPHCTGGGIFGGGRYLAESLNIWPARPSAVQFAIAIVPPGLQTLISSLAVISGRGQNIAPNIDITTSKVLSSYGIDSASPCSNLISYAVFSLQR